MYLVKIKWQGVAAKISFSRFDRRFWLIFGVILPNPPAPTRHRSRNAIFCQFHRCFQVILPNAPAPTRYRSWNAIFGRFLRFSGSFSGSFCQILPPQRDIDPVTLFFGHFPTFSGHFAKSSCPNETSIW